jgi:hypothetical protein
MDLGNSDPAWLKLLIVSMGPITGVITAIVVAWLTHLFASRRDVRRESAELKEAIRKERANAEESTRLEHLRRKLAALEAFTRSVLVMDADLNTHLSVAVRGNAMEWNAASRIEPGVTEASTLVTMYFHDRLEPEWSAYVSTYRSCRRDAAICAMANALLSDEIPNPTNLTKQDRLAQYQGAVTAAAKSSAATLVPQQALLRRVSEYAAKVRKSTEEW